MINSYRDLLVWQKAIELAKATYDLTAKFPSEEKFGLVSQMRRAAVSIPSNIAEGRCRGTRKDFLQFLRIAYGSGAELETQMHIAERLGFSKDFSTSSISAHMTSVMKMLNSMIHSLSKSESQKL